MPDRAPDVYGWKVLKWIPTAGRYGLRLFVIGLLLTGGLGYGQGPDSEAIPAAPAGGETEVVPVVTRAWVHDEYGRIVFDWPGVVAYGTRLEGKTLTVMFDRRLHTTFQSIQRYLSAYITEVQLGPDGQSVRLSLTDEYRLRTFLLNSDNGGVKVVIDLLNVAQLDTNSTDSDPIQLAQATPREIEVAPEETSPVEADSTHETAPEPLPSPSPLPEAEGKIAGPDGLPAAMPPAAESASESTPGLPSDTEADPPPEPADTDPPPESALTAAEPLPTETPARPEAAMETASADASLADPAARPESAPSAGPDASAAPAPSPTSEEFSPAATAPPATRPEAAMETASADAPLADPAARPESASSAGPDASAEPAPETASEEPPLAAKATPAARPESAQALPISLPPSLPLAVRTDSEPEAEGIPTAVHIPVSQSRLFRLGTPVASIFVANPDIADVQLVSSGVLFVVGRAVGRTSVAALNADSNLIGEWTITTVLDLQPVRTALEGVGALKNVAVRSLNRGVELSGTVASIAEADLALRLTTVALPEEIPVENRIDVTGMQQINLEVQIAEVQRSVSETLGFNWEVLPNIGGGRGLGFQVGRLFFDEAAGFISQGLSGGQAAALFGTTGIGPGRTTVRGLIDALATAGLATVLARPNVTAVSGETASFFSGGEYPLPAGYEDGAIIFQYKKYGVLLDFVPTIIDSGRIMLTVRPEVSQRSETDSLRAAGIDIPVINVRRAETTVEIGDGESIVIAGLYRDQSEAIESGLPVVKDMPLLGLLFGTQSVRSNAIELVVVVTARLTTATTLPRTTDRDRQLPGRRLRGYHY